MLVIVIVLRYPVHYSVTRAITRADQPEFGLLYSGDEDLKAIIGLIGSFGLVRRAGSRSDLVAALRFFCSDDAGWVSGQVTVVDGYKTVRI